MLRITILISWTKLIKLRTHDALFTPIYKLDRINYDHVILPSVLMFLGFVESQVKGFEVDIHEALFGSGLDRCFNVFC